MSSEDDQLCLNITSGDQVSTTFSPKRHKWSKRKQGAEKRTLSCSSQDSRCSPKQRRLVKDDVKEGGKESGSTNIKTSSLFKHNPDIPDISRPAVAQLKEEIFTSDCFSGLNLHPHLVATLEKVLNVSTLTSVQKQTIPQLLAGRDAVVRSQTGSGKTLSYAVPMVQSLQASQPRVQRSDGPLALVIVPTRELALQTLHTFQQLLKPFTWIVPGVLMGGEKRKSEKARLRKGINILVSTPGRLVDHIKNTLSITFSSVRWLVLDEADRTLDLGFEKDLTVILNSLNKTGVKRQNVLLSATLTHGVTRLVDVCLKDPVSVQVCRSASSDPDADSLAAAFEPSTAGQSDGFALPEALRQFVVMVPSKLRLVCLASFLLGRCKDKVIVFVSSCECVEFLHSLLTSVLSSTAANHEPPLNFLRLHGNMKQEERSLVYQNFSESASGVLLCTDVAARGLHLPQVTWIVQYTPPAAAAEYVHRVGRTARIGGGGSSLLFLAPSESLFISELANHSVSLSEMKLSDILSTLMTDDTYKGRGKYHSKTSSKALEQETRERATVLQTHFENFVHADAQRLQSAKKALQSFLRAYTTFPAALKHIFHIRALHLGHVAKSFGLRDAPQRLSAADAKQPSHKKQSGRQDRKQQAGHKRLSGGQREVRLLRSEFSSGLEADHTKKTKKKKKMTLSEEEEQ